MSKTVRSLLTVLAVATAALAAAPPVDLPGWAALLIAALAAGFGALGIVPPTFDVRKARDVTIARKGKTPATSVETPVLGPKRPPRARNTAPKAIVGRLRGRRRLTFGSLLAALVACLVAFAVPATASTAPNTRQLEALVAKWPAGSIHHIALPRRTVKHNTTERSRAIARAASCAAGYFSPAAYSPWPPDTQAQPMYFCSPDYLHFGDAQYFLAYGLNWCTGYPCDTEGWSVTQLNGVGHNMFGLPTTNIWTRYSNTYLLTTAYWYRPDNRTFCWYRTQLSGADGASNTGPENMPIVGVGGLDWACGAY